MMRCAKRLNEPKSAHHRAVGRPRELGCVAIVAPRRTGEMGWNPRREEYFHEPLIDVSEQACAVTSCSCWFTPPFGLRAQLSESLALEVAPAVVIDHAERCIG